MVRLISLITLGLLAFAAQALVLVRVVAVSGAEGTPVPWGVLVVSQCLAALAAAACFACIATGKPLQYRKGIFIHAFCLCFLLPVGGQLLFLAVALAPVFIPCSRRSAEAQLVPPPDFLPSFISPHREQAAVARLRRKLDVGAQASDQRVDAMVAMRSVPLHYTGDMLLSLLSDPHEEIRLLAYGITSGVEGTVVQKIVTASHALERSTDREEQARLNSELAQLYWELIYQKLVRGELSRHTLEHVELYARTALSLDQSNAAMWYLLGRCALMQEDALQAEFFLLHAKKRNFPAVRVLPWLAEAAYMKRDFARIAPLLMRMRGQPLPPVLQSTVNYWTP